MGGNAGDGRRVWCYKKCAAKNVQHHSPAERAVETKEENELAIVGAFSECCQRGSGNLWAFIVVFVVDNLGGRDNSDVGNGILKLKLQGPA